jgi:hypothetical protein
LNTITLNFSLFKVPVGRANRLENIPALVGREFYLPKWIGIDTAIADIQLSSLYALFQSFSIQRLKEKEKHFLVQSF